MATLGKRLRRARENKKLSQTRVFEITGINNKTLSRYENDGTEPDANSLKLLAELYEVTFDWLYGQDEKKSASALPDSAYEKIVDEAESRFGVNLRDDPLVAEAFRNTVELIARTKLNKSQ